MKMIYTFKAALTGAALAVAGSAAAAEDCKNPDTLRFSMIPTEETTQELALYEPMVNKLKEATGKDVEFFLPTSYASVVEAMLGGFVDIGFSGIRSWRTCNLYQVAVDVYRNNVDSRISTVGWV